MPSDRHSPVSSYLDWADSGKPAIWRYALGLVLMLLIFFVLSSFAILPLAMAVILHFLMKRREDRC